MGRIKIKDMEGNEADLRKLFQKSGCSLACCIWNSIFSLGWQKVAILGLFLLTFIIILLVHFNFRNWHLTAITGVAVLTIVLIAMNVYSPGEIARKIGNT